MKKIFLNNSGKLYDCTCKHLVNYKETRLKYSQVALQLSESASARVLYNHNLIRNIYFAQFFTLEVNANLRMKGSIRSLLWVMSDRGHFSVVSSGCSLLPTKYTCTCSISMWSAKKRFPRLTRDQCPFISQCKRKKVYFSPYIYAKAMKNP